MAFGYDSYPMLALTSYLSILDANYNGFDTLQVHSTKFVQEVN